MEFELWDNQSGNLIGTFDTEQEALQKVAFWLKAGMFEFAKNLALDGPDDEGINRQLAGGNDLLDRVRQKIAA